MVIWVTGAEGQLGRSLQRLCHASSERWLFTDREVDLTDRERVFSFVQREQVDVIINCAAYTDVERAEEEEEQAYAVNATAVGYLAEAAKVRDALLIHISTDYVFMGGCCALLTEQSQPNPINAYGRTKLAGEELIRQSGCHYMIFRTAWLYSPYGKNFVKTILRLASERSQIRVVNDQIGSPTSALDLAAALLTVVHEGRFVEGLYHYTNLGECSWWEFAREILRLAKSPVEVTPCSSADYPTRALRPKNTVLDKTKVQQQLGISIPHWKISLEQCLDELQA
ncbi:MAG: dTDP-4-dehydrorhamnose reductase [Alistipes sp.]|nr:dTDP-4-dehydrorhamnose reductase [Alistipes sp.]